MGDSPPEMQEMQEIQSESSSGSEFVSKSRINKDTLGRVQHPITISWRNLNYHVNIEKGSLPLGKKVIQKQILFNVTGHVRPGEFIAIMGPTGSGKTTLLNILGRRLKRNVTGEILFNGRAPGSSLKRLIGYVMQDDLFHGSLTVRQILELTARLRLPESQSDAEKLKRVDEVIDVLNLGKAANSIVGGHMQRGVSGGERKRLNIGNELLINPSLLLLDEPTSGLDSSTALVLTHTLKALTSGNRTVITSIHQPSSQMFAAFDKLMLMADGKMVYFGPARDAVAYFSKLAYPCQPNFNPADYLLALMCEEEMDDAAMPVKQKLIDAYQGGDIQKKMENYQPRVEASVKLPKYTSSWWTQMVLLTVRAARLKSGSVIDPLNGFQHIAIAIVMGLIWFQVPKEEEYIRPTIGALFFLCVYWFINPFFKYVQAFPAEHAIVQRERASGAYRLSAYYFAKSIAELPFELIYPSIFFNIFFWMGGFSTDPLRFFVLWALVLFNVLLGQGLGMFMSAWLMDISKAVAFTATFFLAQMLMGGFYINTDLMPVWFRWAQFLSINKYMYDIVVSLIMTDGTEWEASPEKSLYNENPIQGDTILEMNNIDKDMVPLWMVILTACLVVSRILGYIGLRYMHKPKY
mmetsp:Transcript_7951/g.20032  ORF Transcript_7951/g.20032 Transcript_7951/m.20032 type:complete len:634 (-) Transcript_7951:51-1952(-)